MKKLLNRTPRKVSSNFGIKLSLVTVAGCAVIAIATASIPAKAPPQQNAALGTAVACPWVFDGGDPTSQETALSSVDEIMQKAGYATIPPHDARAAWTKNNLREPRYRNLPTRESLEAFGRALHASKIYYGSVSWHTRSIWVDLGPKTISTATVNAYVFDVAADKVVYRSKGVEGRSDEKENGYKVAADILITPLVTVVSGGPATPHEQRAVQIALGRAYHSWVKPGSTK